MAIGVQLLTGLPLIWGVSITVLDTFLLLYLQKMGMRKMEAFIIALVGIIAIAFLIQVILAKPAIDEIAKGFVPSFPDSDALYIAIGIIGATVMPHNLYLHSALVQSRKIEKKKRKQTKTFMNWKDRRRTWEAKMPTLRAVSGQGLLAEPCLVLPASTQVVHDLVGRRCTIAPNTADKVKNLAVDLDYRRGVRLDVLVTVRAVSCTSRCAPATGCRAVVGVDHRDDTAITGGSHGVHPRCSNHGR